MSGGKDEKKNTNTDITCSYAEFLDFPMMIPVELPIPLNITTMQR